MNRRHGKIALLIDGPNLHSAARVLGFDVDYRRLLSEFQSEGTLVRACFYTTIFEGDEFSTIRPLLDWLEYNGYTVITKVTKEFVDAGGYRTVKGNMGVDLAIDAMQLASHVDHIVLFSGDGAFRPLVGALQRRGVLVTVVSTLSTNPPAIASELRRQADRFVDLKILKAKVSKASE